MNMKRRISALLTAAVMSAGASAAMPGYQADAAVQYQNILILGDGISSGRELEDGEAGYYDLIGEYAGGELTNLAVSGYKTSDLLAQINNVNYADTIKNADLICISIGSNDLLKPTQAYFNTLREEGELMMQTLWRIAREGDIRYHMGQLTSTLREPRTEAKENYTQIEIALRALNPDAKIIMQTLYNPFELSDKSYADGFSEFSRADYQDFLDYVTGLENQLNKAMRGLTSVEIAEVGDAFNGAGWAFVRSGQNDMYPSALGHAMIGTVILDMLGITGVSVDCITPGLEALPALDYMTMSEKAVTILNKYATPSSLEFGDVDGDRDITTYDAQIVLQTYVNWLAQGDVAFADIRYGSYRVADVDGDGTLTSSDAQCILQYYVNRIVGNTITWFELTGNPNAPDA